MLGKKQIPTVAEESGGGSTSRYLFIPNSNTTTAVVVDITDIDNITHTTADNTNLHNNVKTYGVVSNIISPTGSETLAILTGGTDPTAPNGQYISLVDLSDPENPATVGTPQGPTIITWSNSRLRTAPSVIYDGNNGINGGYMYPGGPNNRIITGRWTVAGGVLSVNSHFDSTNADDSRQGVIVYDSVADQYGLVWTENDDNQITHADINKNFDTLSNFSSVSAPDAHVLLRHEGYGYLGNTSPVEYLAVHQIDDDGTVGSSTTYTPTEAASYVLLWGFPVLDTTNDRVFLLQEVVDGSDYDAVLTGWDISTPTSLVEEDSVKFGLTNGTARGRVFTGHYIPDDDVIISILDKGGLYIVCWDVSTTPYTIKWEEDLTSDYGNFGEWATMAVVEV